MWFPQIPEMKDGEKAALIIAFVIASMSLFVDKSIAVAISGLRAYIPDWFFIGFTFEIQTFIVLFFLTSLFLINEKKRRWVAPLWFTAFIAIGFSYLLKILIARPRPYESGVVTVLEIAAVMLGSGASTWNFSFPSFQAVLAFSALPILDKEFRRFRWVWLGIACVIAFSRVYFGVHYLSDVMFGGILGYLIGLGVVRLEEKHKMGEALARKLGFDR